MLLETTSTPLRIVILDEELPYPATSGKRIRSLNLVCRLAERHQITYMAHRNRDANEARAAEVYLREHGIEPVLVDHTIPAQTGLGFYGRLVGNLFSAYPYSVATHNSRALREAARDHAANNRVDLWQCEWTPYAAALEGLVDARWIVIAHNVESLIWRRYFENERHPAKRWYIHKQWKKFERFERSVFSRALRTVAVSEADAVLARERYQARAVSVVDNGVDTSFFVPAEQPATRSEILFLGSLDWRPNLDGIQLLLEKIFPLVQKREPQTRLMLVGRNPPDWLTRLVSTLPGVELRANVADVRPSLHQARVMAVPLRIGGGSRLKILEALACRLPVVSTKVGCEGLDLQPQEHLIVADAPVEFAEGLLRCLANKSPAVEMAERGRQAVLQKYDWDQLADRLEQIWLECAQLPVREFAGAI